MLADKVSQPYFKRQLVDHRMEDLTLDGHTSQNFGSYSQDDHDLYLARVLKKKRISASGSVPKQVSAQESPRWLQALTANGCCQSLSLDDQLDRMETQHS